MARPRNILFIMADQLRWDYLSCAGHPALHTPHIDALAKRGVRFDRAFVQSPVCGPSRMSFYTGRTVNSHGATWNFVPLPVGEMTLGDYLRPSGMRVAVAGKTHVFADNEGMARVGLARESELGLSIAEGGFAPFERDDGEHPDKRTGPSLRYNQYLRAQGYDGDNPWHSWANSAEGPEGEVLSGWSLRHAHLPARVAEKHSETAWMSERAIDFIRESGARPWLLHLSYIKPHWPYIAPAPYHALYGAEALLPVVKSAAERVDPHPVYGAFMAMDAAQAFGRDEVRDHVLPAYMGLVKQIDDHVGRVIAALEEAGRLDDTVIVFTSDHGDYLGDHWMGEKELFHECSVRIPLIIVDPSAAAAATRGTVDHRLVEAIDLVPTFLDLLGQSLPTHRLEGRSLRPLLHGEATPWRACVFSELDFAFYKARLTLGLDVQQARCWMIRTERWKYIAFKAFDRAQLFDLENDPDELSDLGQSAAHAPIRAALQAMLFKRLADRRNRVTVSDADVAARTDGARSNGVIIGEW
ncbi:sulfatase-like hydrolase/transferase [Falsiroseomonas selenitidurans]|uniref:Sulfatase-like hydrolase/transferase n=1 Tax=Falsiroseomonas selenitidurans TaxID=2716335 RepID=A0ABX1E861_9PROT|nr:sulfatase-like hydrolase/transferase [Falsiroseomonas selenitidurans]NKC33410.1 sulfatase-like hydrolase/transferase [Falsiroseomonas selenitidurans]